jgi:hypothetical protein
MTSTGQNFMGLNPYVSQRPRDRLRHFLRRKYIGAHATKALARDMNATAKAAENALNGHWPSDTHLAAIIRRFGHDLLDAVFAPEIEPVLAQLQIEERALDEQLQAARARRRQVEDRSFRDPKRLEAAAAPGEPEGD